MPVLESRETYEDELAALLLLRFSEYEAEAMQLLGSPPNSSNIQAAFYTRLEAGVRSELRAMLGQVFAEAAERLATDLGYEQNIEQARRDAARWADQRAGELSADLRKRIEAAIEQAIASWYAQNGEAGTVEQATAAAALALGVIFSEERAESIAITETTGAITQGERNIANRIEDEFGVRVSAIWRAEADACEICEPLEGTDETEWGLEFPEGPPSPHPRCRCSLEWIVDGEIPEPSQN